MNKKRYIEDKTIVGRRNEIEVKIERITKMLAEENLDGLYINRHQNFAWLTAGASSVICIAADSGEISLFITKDGHKYAITNTVESNRSKEEQKLEELGFEVITQPWYDVSDETIVSGLAGSLQNIGTDMPLGDARLINDKITPLRLSLTENEICKYQYLGDTMSEAMETYIAAVRPGMTELEITGGLTAALWPHEIEQILFLVAADDRIYNYRHPVPTSKKLDKHLMVSCNGRYKGLITTVTRMVYFGTPPNNLLRQYNQNLEIECRMIEATKPGVDDLIPHHVGKDAYKEFGYEDMYYKHTLGGPQGYIGRDYLVTEKVHGITQLNQGYCYNPVISGTKTEDAFIATEEGPLFITKPKSFPKISVNINGSTMERPGILIID